ncbi:unnamed protein product [Pedinophyceae sp. YPF-701]|nr:unnamed protein product [Pedinophyceae sp. YPF-701]
MDADSRAVAQLVRRAADVAIADDRRLARQRAAETSLYQSAQAGDVASLRRLLAEGADPNVGSPRLTHEGAKVPPLCAAAARGQTEAVMVLLEAGIVQLLVAAGADVAAVDNSGKQALYYACCADACETVRVLVEAGAPTEAATPGGHPSLPALHVCAKKGHLASAAALLAGGAHVDVDDGKGLSPLYVAAREGHCDLVKLLVQHGADVNWTLSLHWSTTSPLQAACLNALPAYGRGTDPPRHTRYRETILALIDLGARGAGPVLRLCAERVMGPVISILLDRAAAGTPGSQYVWEVVANVPLAIRTAAKYTYVDTTSTLQLLIDFHLNVAPRLVHDDDPRAADLLGMRGIHLALLEACSLRRTRNVETILHALRAAGVTVPDEQGREAMWTACSHSNAPLIEVLLRHGLGCTPDGTLSEAFVAVVQTHWDCDRRLAAAQVLVSSGNVDVNHRTSQGTTALEACVTYSHRVDISRLVEFLLSVGARPVLSERVRVLSDSARKQVGVLECQGTRRGDTQLERAQRRVAVLAMIDARRGAVEAQLLAALVSARRLDVGLYDALRHWMHAHEAELWRPRSSPLRTCAPEGQGSAGSSTGDGSRSWR